MTASKTLSIVCLTVLFALLPTEGMAQKEPIDYAFVVIQGKPFTKKMRVLVDLGGSPGQRHEAERLAALFPEITSYATVLNEMTAQGYDLEQVLVREIGVAVNGGSSADMLNMRKQSDLK